MKDLEQKIFAAIFFMFWIVVLYHLLDKPAGAVAITKGVFNAGNSVLGTLFTGRAQYAA